MQKVKFRKVWHPTIGVEVSYMTQLDIPLSLLTSSFVVENPSRYTIAETLMSKEHEVVSFNVTTLSAEDLIKVRLLSRTLNYEVTFIDPIMTLTRT